MCVYIETFIKPICFLTSSNNKRIKLYGNIWSCRWDENYEDDDLICLCVRVSESVRERAIAWVCMCLKVMLTKRHSCMQLNYKTAFLQLCKDIYIMHVYVKMFEGVFKCMHECGCLSQRARAFQRRYISKGIHSLSLSVRTSVRPSVHLSRVTFIHSVSQSLTIHSAIHSSI